MKRRNEETTELISSNPFKNKRSFLESKFAGTQSPREGHVNYNDYLSEGFKRISGKRLLNAPLVAIDGIDKNASQSLKESLGIRTIQELAASDVLQKANILCTTGVKQIHQEAGLFDENVPKALPRRYPETESVCGNDDRIRPDPNAPIFEAICFLSLEMPSGSKARGTGFYINLGNGKGAIMTAAHCLYDDIGGSYMKSIKIIRSRSGDVFPHGVITVDSSALRVPEDWKKTGRPEVDYGVILIDDDPWGFGVQALSDSEIEGKISTAGYPSDKIGFFMWYDSGPVSKLTPEKIYYHEDTFGGQSGSPVWIHVPGQTSASVIGVHTYGGCPNSATRVTSDVIRNILSWTQN